MTHQKKLVVLGSTNIDHILNVPYFLAPGETLSAHQYQVAMGGKGANQAVAAGRAGANIQFITALGDDHFGQDALDQFQTDGIDTSLIKIIPHEKTGVALIFVNDEGENMIGIHAGANAHVTPQMLANHWDAIESADALLMQLEIPIETIQQATNHANEHGVLVALNPAPARPLPDELLSKINIITPNETEAEILTGIKVDSAGSAIQASKILHDKGVTVVIITMGKLGAWVSENGVGHLIPGFKVDAIDTIAAGDTFNGVLMTALLEGLPLQETIRKAHAAAAIAVTRKGAQPSIPWASEIDDFLMNH
ncbi:ribokinase [Wohlfahrtiimonas larvae]|uniref:Ribokinase n=1 Tax=Wohlfahrtiimonas larvae TaxID=1157986 RepID=A0ABP9MW03_9GAMM|nr:ribokinase [Wohlfahrtiimonas larvae]